MHIPSYQANGVRKILQFGDKDSTENIRQSFKTEFEFLSKLKTSELCRFMRC